MRPRTRVVEHFANMKIFLQPNSNNNVVIDAVVVLAVNVNVTVRCPSFRPSVCPVDRQQQRSATDLLRRSISAVRARSGRRHAVIRGQGSIVYIAPLLVDGTK